ncbi:MAG: MFS transporter [Deinococcales bacterium]
MMTKENNNHDMSLFSWRLAMLVGLVSLIEISFWSVFNIYVPIFLQAGNEGWTGAEGVRGFALAPTLAYFIMTLDNIFLILLSAWAGEQSGKRWFGPLLGRRKPWILGGTLLSLGSLFFIPLAVTLPIFFAAIIVNNTGHSLLKAPAKAWIGDFFKVKDYDKANGVYAFLGSLGAFVALVIGGRFFDAGYRIAPFLVIAVLFVIVMIILFFFLKEPPLLTDAQSFMQEAPTQVTLSFKELLSDMLHGRNNQALYAFLTVLLFNIGYGAQAVGISSFAVFELGMDVGRAGYVIVISTLCFVLSVIPSGMLASRFGRKRVMNLGILLYIGVGLLAIFFVHSVASFLAVAALVGLAWALVYVGAFPLILEAGKGHDSGVYSALFVIATQLAFIIGPVIAGVAIELSHTQRSLFVIITLAFISSAFMLRQVPTNITTNTSTNTSPNTSPKK